MQRLESIISCQNHSHLKLFVNAGDDKSNVSYVFKSGTDGGRKGSEYSAITKQLQ